MSNNKCVHYPNVCKEHLCAVCLYNKEAGSDYVSKKELREWCEFAMCFVDGELAGYGTESVERKVISSIFDTILEKFCKEGE